MDRYFSVSWPICNAQADPDKSGPPVEWMHGLPWIMKMATVEKGRNAVVNSTRDYCVWFSSLYGRSYAATGLRV